MKKGKILWSFALVSTLVCGCSCSKVNEQTYENAVNTLKNTDAISFSRIEEIHVEGQSTYTKKRVDANYILDANKEVINMERLLNIYDVSTSEGSTTTKETYKYYYSRERQSLYTYSKIGEIQIERYKEKNTTYNKKFNINTCDNLDCMQMIVGNFVPAYKLNELENFNIEDNDGKGIATFTATCPSFESCASNSQVINYTVNIDLNGNIESLSYSIENGNTTHSIKYVFYGYGANNVSVVFPADLESSYLEKK